LCCVLLKEKCLNLEQYLKHDNLLDLELNILKGIIGLPNDKPIDILNYIKTINYFSNVYIAYGIMLKIQYQLFQLNFFSKFTNKILFKINNISTKIKRINFIVY